LYVVYAKTIDQPTHIIKLKSMMNATTAYTLSRKKQDDPSLYRRSFSVPDAIDLFALDDNFTVMSGIFSDNAFIDYLHDQYAVEYVEPNHIYKAQVQYTNLRTEVASSWGLARINTRYERNNLSHYTFDEFAGEGVHVYVLDTGVNIAHVDFGDRATNEANFVEEEGPTDLGGHGTHVAGKIAGSLYGIAKKANVHSVKILNRLGDGALSNIIKGISHVITVAEPGKSIINLSLSGPKSQLIDDILTKVVVDHHIPVFVAAGNSASDACLFSPSSNPHVFSVGASDLNDDVPAYSNVGGCVQLYAPGSEIESTWINGQNQSKILDGTSMANPHVSGIAAALLSKRTYANVQELYQAIALTATVNTLSFKWSAPVVSNNNLLAFINSYDLQE
ncbi:subtilisin-like serine protease, partial [Rhizopus stolonifer]